MDDVGLRRAFAEARSEGGLHIRLLDDEAVVSINSLASICRLPRSRITVERSG